MALQTLVGLVAATILALVSYRLRALTRGGAIAAAMVGTLIYASGGLPWASVLLLFFASGSLLSRYVGVSTGAIAEKSGTRDMMQVFANGGIGALAAAVHLVSPSTVPVVAYVGALAAATADTSATELGSRWGGTPRQLFTWAQVPPGTSGAVTGTGLAASVLGATFIGVVAAVLIQPAGLLGAGVVAGIAGSLADSVLGATIQERRFCQRCGTATEQRVHEPCGTPTQITGGLPHLDNDMVNLAATVVGAAVAVGWFSLY